MEPVTARLSLRLDWRTALGLLATATVLQIVLSLLGTGPGWTSVVGVHVGLLALAPWRWWPRLLLGIAATTGAAGALDVGPPSTLLIQAVAAAVLAAAGAAVVRQGTAKLLRTPGDLARLVVAASAVGGLCAVIELGTGLARVGVAPEARVLAASMLMHALSVLILTPVVLVVGRVRRRGPGWGLALHLGALAATTALVFATDLPVTVTLIPVALLGLAAYVFDLAVVTLELALYLGLVTVLSARDLGPFGRLLPEGASPHDAAALTQAYSLGTAVVVLTLAIALHQQRRLLARITADEQLLRLNYEHAPVGMLLLEPDRDRPGRLVVEELNDAACAVLGVVRADLVGRSLDALLHTDDEMPVVEDGLVGDRPVWRSRATVRGPEASRVDVVLTSIGSRSDGPSYSAQLLDVTRELAAGRQVADARQLAETTIDTAGCVILVTDAQGVVRRVNAATQDITGYSPGDLLGSLLWDTPVSPSGRADLEALLMWPNRSGRPVVNEGTVVAKDGRRLRLVWNSNVVGAEAGQPAYCVVTGVDVTLERASTGLINHLMQASIGTAIVGTDLQGRITSFNTGAEHLLGCTVPQVMGRPFADFLDSAELDRRGAVLLGRHRDDRAAAFLVLAERLADGVETPAVDWTWITSAGERRVVSMTLSAMGDASGRHGYLCVGRDVTRAAGGPPGPVGGPGQGARGRGAAGGAGPGARRAGLHDLARAAHPDHQHPGLHRDPRRRRARAPRPAAAAAAREHHAGQPPAARHLQRPAADRRLRGRGDGSADHGAPRPARLRPRRPRRTATAARRARAARRGRLAGRRGGRGRRPRPARARGEQPHQQRGQVHRRRRRHHDLGVRHRGRGVAPGQGHRHGHRRGGPAGDLRALLPHRRGAAPGHRGHRAGPLDRRRHRPRPRRSGRGHLGAGCGHHLHPALSAGRGARGRRARARARAREVSLEPG